MVRNHIQTVLGDKKQFLFIDETDFLKEGKSSCTVGLYTILVGKIINYQNCIPLCYVLRFVEIRRNG